MEPHRPLAKTIEDRLENPVCVWWDKQSQQPALNKSCACPLASTVGDTKVQRTSGFILRKVRRRTFVKLEQFVRFLSGEVPRECLGIDDLRTTFSGFNI